MLKAPKTVTSETVTMLLQTLCVTFVMLLISANQASMMTHFVQLAEQSPCLDFKSCTGTAHNGRQFNLPDNQMNLGGLIRFGRQSIQANEVRPNAPARLEPRGGVANLSAGRNININVLSNIPFVDILKTFRGDPPSQVARATPSNWRPRNTFQVAFNRVPAFRTINSIRG